MGNAEQAYQGGGGMAGACRVGACEQIQVLPQSLTHGLWLARPAACQAAVQHTVLYPVLLGRPGLLAPQVFLSTI
jgi:hypothetical protein